VRRILVPALTIAIAAGCGGDSDGSNPGNNGITPPNGSNVVALLVDPGPIGASGSPVGYVNGAFVTVTVCVPGTSNCQDIDHVLVDTGSSGLRLLANDGKAGGKLSLPLPPLQNSAGNPIAQCAQFLDGFTWGPVRLADVRLGGEKAGGISIQVISQADFAVPASCASGGKDEDTLEGSSGLQTNGILGIGLFRQDCGEACTVDPALGNPGLYFKCQGSGQCSATALALANQVSNPVASFAADNNGVIIELPLVPSTGAPSTTGSLVFGIGTQSNNGLGSATVFAVDGAGTLISVFPPNGSTYSGSFIDSGSNGIFFLSSSSTGIPECPELNGFYCPANTLSLSAQIRGAGGTPTEQVAFSVASARNLFASNNTAFANLGGTGGGPPGQDQSFDWGLPFFFGRNVYTAIEGASTPGGPGPWFAY